MILHGRALTRSDPARRFCPSTETRPHDQLHAQEQAADQVPERRKVRGPADTLSGEHQLPHPLEHEHLSVRHLPGALKRLDVLQGAILGALRGVLLGEEVVTLRGVIVRVELLILKRPLHHREASTSLLQLLLRARGLLQGPRYV